MSAKTAMRMRWRRWASSLPVIVALLFATTTVAGTAEPGPGAGPGHVPIAGPMFASAHQAVGQRPDVPVVKRGGSWTVASGLQILASASTRACIVPTGWWLRRQGVDGHRAQRRQETYQGRGPPGRRAAHVPS